MKLNYKRTICVGFAFFLICAFWQAYDNTIPLILTNKFGMSQAWSGVIMALDNILALFLLPLFVQRNFGIELPGTLEIIILLFIFYHFDMKAYRKDIAAGLKPDISKPGTEVKIRGSHNLIFIIMIVIAVILSAQCTDARVNIVTKDLFQKYPSLEAFANADLKELEQDIHSTGFYHNKAKNIISCARTLVEKYDGEVPRELEELTALAGVGRKTANVIRGNIYHEPSVVVDTHVKRISKKLGFTKEDDPVKIEYDLMKVLPKDHWILYNIQIITLGRSICTARNPKCTECFLSDLCKGSGK